MVTPPTSLPDGFASAAKDIAILPNEILSEMCQNVLMFLQYKKKEVDINHISQQLEIANISLTQDSLQKIINLLCCHYRDSISKHLSSESFLESMQGLRLHSEEINKIIVDVWEKQENFSNEELKEHLNVGELLDMDWKLSMSLSSSSCKNLHSPSITLLIKVLQANGEIVKKSFEMTIEQFQNFSKQIEDSKSVLETV